MARPSCGRIFRAPSSTSIAKPYELDPKLFDETPPSYANTRSLRVAGRPRDHPRVVAEGQAIYRDRIRAGRRAERIETYYKPYHAMLEGLMNADGAAIRRRLF